MVSPLTGIWQRRNPPTLVPRPDPTKLGISGHKARL
jgi:hypothetical protein